MDKKKQGEVWGIIYDEQVMGMDKEFGSHWVVVDTENEYEPVGEPDDIQSVIEALIEDDVITREDINSFDYYADVDEFVDYLNDFIDDQPWHQPYQVVYFYYKERIDGNFFASKEECEKYIESHKYNYAGKNILAFQVVLRDTKRWI